MDAVEEAGDEFAAEGFDCVDVVALLLGEGEEAVGHGVGCEGLAGFDEDDAVVGAGGLAGGGAAVAVGGGEVADGGAADEEALELAVGDDVYGLRGDALVVDGVGADETLAVEGGESGVGRVWKFEMQ